MTDTEETLKLKQEIEHLNMRLQEMEETMASVCGGTADSIIVSTVDGDKIYALKTEEQPYRFFVENMPLGAVMLSDDDTVLYCNRAFVELLKEESETVVGEKIQVQISEDHVGFFNSLLTKSRRENLAQQGRVALQVLGGAVDVAVFVSQLRFDSFQGVCLVFVKQP